MEQVDLVQTFHDFLKRMRDPAAADLVRSIKSFIVNFLNSPLDPDADSTGVQEFLSTTEIAFKAHPLWANATEEELESAGEGLEKYVMTKLFNRAFAPLPSDASKDQELSDKISLLQQFVKPENLDLAPNFHNEASWLLAQKELQKINCYKAPRDKLVCILNCCRVINNLLLNVSMAKNDRPPGADDFLPALIFVVIKANPPQLHSNLQYIQRYRHSSRLVSEAAYFYTNLVSAESFIRNINGKSLSMEEAEFEQQMQVAQSNLAPEKQQTSSEFAPSSRNPAQATRSEAGSRSPEKAPQSSTNAEVAKLEAGGASGVVEAERSGQLLKEYPFLYATAGDLRVSDVEKLLSEYKELVLRHVALVKGLENSGKAPVKPSTVSSSEQQGPQKQEASAVKQEEHAEEQQQLQQPDLLTSDGLHVSEEGQTDALERSHDEEQWEKVTH